MLEQMAKMFADMGMPIDVELLQNMMRQVRDQFEEMGLDPDRMASTCLLYTSPSPRDRQKSRMPSSA